MSKATYPDFAAAVGAWVTAEMRAAMAEPQRMLAALDATAEKTAVQFDGVAFEDHLNGMLSDLIEFASIEKPNEPVTLCVGPEWPLEQEAQWCLQGYAWFEQGDTFYYGSVEDLLAAFLVLDLRAAYEDPEGYRLTDAAECVSELGAELDGLGGADDRWCMRVEPDDSGEYAPGFMLRGDDHFAYDSTGALQMFCALGRVTIWSEAQHEPR